MANFRLGSHIWALAVFLQIAAAGHTDLHLNTTACNSHFLVSNSSTLSVALAQGSFPVSKWGCDFEFATAESGAGINLLFGSSHNPVFNEQAFQSVSISFYANQNSRLTLLETYEYGNWSEMKEQMSFHLPTDKLLVTVNGEWSQYWATAFNLSQAHHVNETTVAPTPQEDVFSLAGGVFALALGSTVFVTLLLVILWCCCCKTNDTPEQVMARRRRRMIDQLAKDGYSVTRDYGSTAATAPLLRDQFGEIFTHPEQRAPALPRDASGYDLPPSYDSVRPSARQHGYGPVAPTAPRPPAVPEAILIRIEDDATPVIAPTAASSQRDLMEFGTSGEHARNPAPDLLSD